MINYIITIRGVMDNIYKSKRKVTRILGYFVVIVIVFVISLFVIPFKFFFISAAFVLIALREIEKEFHKSDMKTFRFFGKKSV